MNSIFDLYEGRIVKAEGRARSERKDGKKQTRKHHTNDKHEDRNLFTTTLTHGR